MVCKIEGGERKPSLPQHVKFSRICTGEKKKRKRKEKKRRLFSPHFHFSKSFPSFSSSSQFWTSHRHMAGHAFAWASVRWKMIDARTVQAGHLHKFSFFGTGRTLDWTFSPLSPFWERWRRRRRRMVPCLWWLAKKRGRTEGRATDAADVKA